MTTPALVALVVGLLVAFLALLVFIAWGSSRLRANRDGRRARREGWMTDDPLVKHVAVWVPGAEDTTVPFRMTMRIKGDGR